MDPTLPRDAWIQVVKQLDICARVACRVPPLKLRVPEHVVAALDAVIRRRANRRDAMLGRRAWLSSGGTWPIYVVSGLGVLHVETQPAGVTRFCRYPVESCHVAVV